MPVTAQLIAERRCSPPPPVPLLLCSRCQRGVTVWSRVPVLGGADFELQTIRGGPARRKGTSLWSCDRADYSVFFFSGGRGWGELKGRNWLLGAMLAPAFHHSGPGVNLAHIGPHASRLCVKQQSFCDFPDVCFPSRCCCFLQSDSEEGLSSNSLVPALGRAAGTTLRPPTILPRQA